MSYVDWKNEVSAQNFDRLGELGIDEMKIDLGNVGRFHPVIGYEGRYGE
jgi:hypothetical protein